jgi:hypothetical protein
MKMNYKRSLKLITLLITSLLIAAVSAATYSYMYIEGSGQITTGGLKWEKGVDAPTGALIQGYTVKDLNLSIPKNTPKNFTDCLHLINQDSTLHTFSLEVTVVGGDSSNFTTFDLIVYNSTARYATLTVKSQGSVLGLTIAGSSTLNICFDVNPVTDATGGYFYFTVKFTYE